MNKKLMTVSCGFTLLELLIVMVILGILAAVAAPTMQSTSKSSAVRAHQKNIMSALAYARGEAVARNKLVSMCPSADAETCDAGNDWSGGWLIFIDDSAGGFGNGVFNGGEELLRAFEYPGANNVAVVDPDAANAPLNALSWNFRGFTRGDQRALVIVCDRDNENSRARGLLIERSGRVIQSRDADGDGVHESEFADIADSSLSCS